MQDNTNTPKLASRIPWVKPNKLTVIFPDAPQGGKVTMPIEGGFTTGPS